MKYKNIYYFQVVNELLAGNAVFVVDRKEGAVCELSSDEITVKGLLTLLDNAKNDRSSRYSFWMEDEKTEGGQEDDTI